MSQLRGAVAEFFEAVADSVDFVDGDLTDTLTESGKVAFLFEWEQKLREAVMADIRAGGSYEFKPQHLPPPLNGGGLFVRED